MHVSTTYIHTQIIFLERDYNTPSIYIMPCTPYRVTHNYMLDLSYYDVAKLQIVYGE